ncbi:MAG: hypothetical protein KJ655_04710 [Candidatus Thermoplasmatota archaeon]|nr:hypothetical protein [Candidatus Thermoplasmatota archaeon]
MRKELREDFSGAEIKMKIEKKTPEEKKEKEEKPVEEKKNGKGKTILSGLLLGTGVFLIFTLPYKLIIKGYFSHYYLITCIFGIVLAGVGTYIIPKKQKAVAIGVGVIMFIICALIFSLYGKYNFPYTQKLFL